MNKRTTIFENSLIWFGAAVSLAEIHTGTYFASLGFTKGITAIVLGHFIGCVLLFLAGIMGGKTRKSSMETVKMSFGRKGSFIFALMNVLQLVGWTAIMIYDGAIAANGIYQAGQWLWAAVIGGLIICWILIGIKSIGKINVVAISALFALTVILSFVIFGGKTDIQITGESLSFGAAVELSVAMPLSWLPLISDYTREAEKPIKATAVSSVVYGIVSCWMYVIGMGASIYADTTDIAQIMIYAGLGVAGLIIIVISTVTTTFLDAYSAGISSESLYDRISGKWVAVAVTIIGTVCAMYSMQNITEFLYLIGSVFAPMIAVQIADYFILKKDNSQNKFDLTNIVIWIIGFVLYRLLMKIDIVTGSTLPDMLVTIIICIIVDKIKK